MEERLQKIIARAGVTSRRKAEELIEQGEVTVNGRVVTELGSKADAARDHIKVRGKLIVGRPKPIYLALNKPKGCVSTTSDPEGRQTVLDLAGPYRSKVYPVGRLDYHSEGLLLLTNDGDFANYILSAKNAVPKTYHVKANGNPTAQDLERFRNGIRLDGRMTAPARIRPLKPGPNPWFEVTLAEGRQNQIRRMFKAMGFLVEKLKRVRIGSLALGTLASGKFRELTHPEVAALTQAESAARSRVPRKTVKSRKKSRPAGRKEASSGRPPRKSRSSKEARSPKKPDERSRNR